MNRRIRGIKSHGVRDIPFRPGDRPVQRGMSMLLMTREKRMGQW